MGEDFYDTCYTLSALLLFQSTHGSLAGFKKAISQAANYIAKEIDEGFASQAIQEWYGAGFHGAALALLGRHGKQLSEICGALSSGRIKTYLQQLLSEAKKFYKEQGDYAFFKADLTSSPTTPDEWHTAEVLIGLHYGTLRGEDPVCAVCSEDPFCWRQGATDTCGTATS